MYSRQVFRLAISMSLLAIAHHDARSLSLGWSGCSGCAQRRSPSARMDYSKRLRILKTCCLNNFVDWTTISASEARELSMRRFLTYTLLAGALFAPSQLAWAQPAAPSPVEQL